MTTGTVTLLLFVIFILLIVIGVPIGFSLGAAGVVGLILMDQSFMLFAQTLISGIDNFALLAIPFYVLLGAVMERGGISKSLIDLGDELLGFLPGGMAIGTVLSSMLFATASGSGPATVAAIGSVTIPEMNAKGYSPRFSVGIAASAGALGPIIPPSIPIIIYGVVAEESIVRLFLGGLGAGLLFALLLMAVCFVKAKKEHVPLSGKKPSLRSIVRAGWNAKLALAAPVIVLGGIYAGIFTPTEAGAIGAVYAILVACFVTRTLGIGDLYACFESTAKTSAMIMFVIAVAYLFAWLMAAGRVPQIAASQCHTRIRQQQDPLLRVRKPPLPVHRLGAGYSRRHRDSRAHPASHRQGPGNRSHPLRHRRGGELRHRVHHRTLRVQPVRGKERDRDEHGRGDHCGHALPVRGPAGPSLDHLHPADRTVLSSIFHGVTFMDSTHIKALLDGAIDMHVHTAPDLIQRKFDDVEAARAMGTAGFSGFVIKSHFAETAGRAAAASRACEGIRVFGGVALNDSVGGLNPRAVEVSLGFGGRIVWMPTVDSANHRSRTGAEGGIGILDDAGRLTAPVYDILDLIKAHDAVIATAHLRLEEVCALVEAARSRGLERIVVTHPEFWMTHVPLDAQKTLAASGVFFERCFYSSTIEGEHATPFDLTARWIREVGPESTVISSDMGQKLNPAPAEAFASMIDTLLAHGVTSGQIETMIKTNPRSLLVP